MCACVHACTSNGPKVAAEEERDPEDNPPSGICQSLTRQSSDPVASRELWKGEKSKSVTKPWEMREKCEEQRVRRRRRRREERRGMLGREEGGWMALEQITI